MSGIYQLNQATGSVTLPSSGNTFIGTSTNSELYSVDSSGNVTVYGTGSGGGGGTIDTGSFATTGSNVFKGSQILTGSLTIHNVGTNSPTLNFENDGASTPLSQIKGQSYGAGIGGGLDFYYYNGSLIEGFQLNNSGNVGIGISNPPQRLTVLGNAEITGSVDSNVTVGVRSQGLVQITDDDTASILPVYNATGSINGTFLNSGSDIPISFVGTTEFPSFGGLVGGGFVLSSGSSVWNAGGQYSAGGTFAQLYYNPNFGGGNENYIIQVGDGSGEHVLKIQKGDASGEGISLKASDITEGFELDHNFSNSSASLFKVKDSGSVNTIFDIRNNAVVFTQVSESLNFVDDTAAGVGGVLLGGIYRSGSDIKIRIT